MGTSEPAKSLPEHEMSRKTSAKIPALPLLALLAGLEAALVVAFMTTGLFLFNVLEGWIAIVIGCVVLAMIIKEFERRITRYS